MKPKKVTYILSNIDKAIAFEWVSLLINKEFIDIDFILLRPSESYLEKFLKGNGIKVTSIRYRSKKDFVSAFFKIGLRLLKNRPSVIHCHLFDASIIGLILGQILFIKKRIYTRHHSTYNWTYNKKGIRYDRIMNKLSTTVVAISENVKQILSEKEGVAESKIQLVHHGFDLNKFAKVENSEVEDLKQKYDLNYEGPVFGVIARWIEWKGIQYIIPAFARILHENPTAVLVLANANGPYREKVNELLGELPPSSYRVIKFEDNLFALYQLFDIYIHTPIDPQIEAFGQTYVEALASGIPSIFTLSGVSKEFINESNACIVPFQDEEAIFWAFKMLMDNPDKAAEIARSGKNSLELFSVERYIRALEKLYLDH